MSTRAMDDSPSPPTGEKPANRWAIGALATLAIVVLYHGAFRMLPAGDDWEPPLSEIHRARVDGVWSLITTNAWQHPMWRPLQSLAFVLLDRLPGDLFTWVSALNFSCVIVAIVALTAWSRAIGLRGVAALVAGVAFAAHPVNTAAIASNDGFGSILTPAVAWLLAWVLYRLRDRPWFALAIVVPGYAVASGVKEYVFALVPMACAVTLLSYPRPIRWTLIVGAILSLETGALLAARRLLTPLRRMGIEIMPGPVAMVRRTIGNTAMGLGASLTPSNTVTFFTTTGHGRIVVITVGVLLTIAIIAAGAALAVIRSRRLIDSTPRTPGPARSVLMIASLTLASLFPANVATRMSEMYLLGLGIGTALLIGIAVREALLARRSIVRVAVLAGVVLWIGWASASTLAKVAEVRRSGELSFALGEFLGETLPRVPGQRVAILYDVGPLRRIGYYSVFRVPRNGLVGSQTVDYFRPTTPATIESFQIEPGGAAPDVAAFDVVIAWDVDAWTGRYIKR